MPIYLGNHPVRQNRTIEEFDTGFQHYLRAKFDEQWDNNFTRVALEQQSIDLAERGTLVQSEDEDTGALEPNIPEPTYIPPQRMSQQDAQLKAKAAGVAIDIPDSGMSEAAVDILINRKKRRAAYEDAINRSPDGLRSLAGFGVSLGTGILDPVNLASAFVPVVGQARYALALSKATGTFGRAGVRAATGFIQGSVGAALIEPAYFTLKQAVQDDYKMLDSVMTVGFGGVMGGTIHVGAGAIGDAFARSARSVVGADKGTVTGSTLTVEPSVTLDRPATELRATGRTAPEILKDVIDREKSRVDAENVPGAFRTAEEKIRLKPYQVGETISPEVAKAVEIAQKPGFDRTADEKIFLDAMMKGKEAEFLSERLGKASEAADAVEVASILKRFNEIGRNPYEAGMLMERVSQETNDAAMKAALQQAAEGKYTDLMPIIQSDKRSGIAGDPAEALRAWTERQQQPEAVRLADTKYAAEAERQIAESPKSNGIKELEADIVRIDEMVDERIALAGISPERIKSELAVEDANIIRAADYAKAARAATLCGL